MKQHFKLSVLTNKLNETLSRVLMLVVVSAVFLHDSALAEVERERKIQESGKIRVCIWPDYFSISYANKKTRQLEGIDIDLSQEFARDLGVEVEYVPTHFGAFTTDLQQDKCDIAMFGVGVTDERAKQIDYSEPYLSSGMYGVASKTNPVLDSWESIDQPGVVVCVQKGTYMVEEMAKGLQHAELVTVVKHNQRELEVRSGRADVFIADYPYAQKMLQVYDWVKLLAPKQATQQFEYAYAIKKGQPQWQARVNAFVQAIKADGRLERAAEKNNLLPIALTPG